MANNQLKYPKQPFESWITPFSSDIVTGPEDAEITAN